MARAPKVAEEAVRDYLEALEDPSKAVDWDLVEDLERQIGETDDPVQRVLLRSEWRKAQIPDFDPLINDFVEFAAAWADANGVKGEDFALEGVPLEVLDRAGLEVAEPVRAEIAEYLATIDIGDEMDTAEVPSVEPSPEEAAPAEEPTFEPGSTMEKVYHAMTYEPFTINKVVERTGASRSTVRAVIDKLSDSNRIEELPPLETGSSGRSPKRYRLTR